MSHGKMLVIDFAAPRGLKSWIAHLFVHLIERLAGRGHYRNFRSYMKEGAFEPLFERQHMVITDIHLSHFGAIALVLTELKKSGSIPIEA
jgi:hypothetical protein